MHMDANLVGARNSGGEGVQCHIDLTTCCTRHQGMDLGDWYAPDSENRLPFDNSEATYERRGNQMVIPCIVGAMTSFRVAYITVAYQFRVLVEVERQYISEYTRLEVFVCG